MRTFLGIALALALLALLLRVAGRQHRLLHFFQLEHYEGARLLLWLRRRSERVLRVELGMLFALYAGAVAATAAGQRWVAGALLLISGAGAYEGVREWALPAVKPLVFTPRARRLFGAALTPTLALTLAAIALAPLRPGAIEIGRAHV